MNRPSSEQNLTPLMRQYNEIKSAHSDAILFFRLGDFYEMFGDDAKEASALLNLVLTKRVSVPMCGIPYHAARGYINRLLNAGKKIAVCEQLTQPGAQKGIVKRDVVEILTPATVLDESYLDTAANNYLICVGRSGIYLSLSCVDLSTGEFEAQAFLFEERAERLRRELLRLSPREALLQRSLCEDAVVRAVFEEAENCPVTQIDDWRFDPQSSFERLLRQFRTANLKGFGFESDDPALVACGPILEYLDANVKTLLPHLNHLIRYSDDIYLELDESTRRHLELTANTKDGGRSFTLFSVLNRTCSVVGQRRLHKMIVNPLKEITSVRERLRKTAFFYEKTALRDEVREALRSFCDLERSASRIVTEKAGARDLTAVKTALFRFLTMTQAVERVDSEGLFPVSEETKRRCEEVARLIDEAIEENAGADISDGGWIREGFSEELDHLRSVGENARDYLQRYLEEEKETTQIPNLRIRENNVIGCFLEVTNSHKSKVPEYFILRQTLTNLERYTTDRLIRLEAEIKSAEEKAAVLEKRLFSEVLSQTAEHYQMLYEAADKVADWDAFQSLSYAAAERGYVCPEVDDSLEIDIRDGRHPIVEKALPAGAFVPNDLSLNNSGVSFAMITGPNMAGKSTYLRQQALIVLMAQIGSFVPASSARIGIVDKIFCRIGASDHIARGESTFLVEMNETANILRNAGERSLVIMDEIGRGTATIDGLSIAQAVCENLMTRRIKTVFATHFHELTLLSSPAMKNFSLQVVENGEAITFLKKVREGACGSSYGIHAARLAGLPDSVIVRAKEILKALQIAEKPNVPPTSVENRLFSPEEIAVADLRGLDIYHRSPLEIVAEVERIQRELNGRS